MKRADENENYPGFGDADDFLPDNSDYSSREPEESGSGDSRQWTGKRRMRPLAKIVLTVVTIAALVLVLNETLLKVRHVRVLGNRTISAATIASEAGLNRPMSLLTIDESRIRRELERDPYLAFVELRRLFPNSIVLVVKERAPCANVQGGGVMYLVDEEAYVLRTFSTTKAQNTLPVVIGMQVSDAKNGLQVVSSRIGRVDEYKAVISELLQQGVVTEYDQINLTDSEHIYLRHKDGYVADLGTAKELMAKIGTLRAVVSALQANGFRNGYIDVTIPGEAIYSPE